MLKSKDLGTPYGVLNEKSMFENLEAILLIGQFSFGEVRQRQKESFVGIG